MYGRMSRILSFGAALGILLAVVPSADAASWLDKLFGRGGDSKKVSVTDLQSGQVITGMDARTDQGRVLRIYVPRGTDRLEVTTSGGRGDLNLYVQYGQYTRDFLDTAQARSTGPRNDERIVIDRPREGWWYIITNAAREYSGVSLQANLLDRYGRSERRDDREIYGYRPPNGEIVTMTMGEHYRELSGRAGSQRYFRIDVPRDAERLVVTLSGGRGNADLYLSRGEKPDTSDYDHVSRGAGNEERIVVQNPGPGPWYAMVRGERWFSDATLRARVREDADADRGHMNRPHDAARLTLGGVLTRAIRPRDEADWIAFEPPSAGEYRFEFPRTDGRLEVTGFLRSRGDDRMAEARSETIARGGEHFRLDVPRSAEQVFLRVRGERASSRDTYEINVRRAR